MTGKTGKDDKPVRVLISHAHDPKDAEPGKRAHWLYRCLRENGVDARIDFNAAPASGWTLWMQQQIRAADYILLVCTALYRRRFEEELSPKEGGRGVRWEGRLLRKIAYEDAQPCRKLKPVLFAGDATDHIPEPLYDCPHYKLPATWTREEASNVLENLLRDLLGKRLYRLPPLGPAPEYEPKSVRQPADTAAVALGLEAEEQSEQTEQPTSETPVAVSTSSETNQRSLWQALKARKVLAQVGALLTFTIGALALGAATIVEKETSALAQATLPRVRSAITEPILVVAPASRKDERQQLCTALKEDGLLTACMEADSLTRIKQNHSLDFVRVVAAIDDSGNISIGTPAASTNDCFRQLRVPYSADSRGCLTEVIRRIQQEENNTLSAATCPPPAMLSSRKKTKMCKEETSWFLRFGASHCDGAEVTREMVDIACESRKSGDKRQARKCFMATFVYLEQCDRAGFCDDYAAVERLRWETAPSCPGNEAALHVQRADNLCKEGDIAGAWGAFDSAKKMLLNHDGTPDSCSAFMIAPTAICLLGHQGDRRVVKERLQLEAIGNMAIDPSPATDDNDDACIEQASMALGARALQFIHLNSYDKAWRDYSAAHKLRAHSHYTLGAAEALMLQNRDAEAIRSWLTNRRSLNIIRRGKQKTASPSQKEAMRALVLLRWRASVRAGEQRVDYRVELEAAYKEMKHKRAFYIDQSNTLVDWLCHLPSETDAGMPCLLYNLVTEPKEGGDLARLRKELKPAL